MGYEREIPLEQLHFSWNNPRCLFVESEEDALCELLLDQGGDKRTNKIVSLAKSIVECGWSPSELLIAKPSEKDNTYTVVEGNRRLAALKCLDNPNILPDSFVTVKAVFEKLPISLVSAVRCYVTDDQTEINELIERRHSGQRGGAGIIPWNSEQRARFMERVSGKSDKVVQLIEYLHSAFGKGTQEEVWLSKCNKTSLARLFGSPYVRERLGFDLVNSLYVARNPDLHVLSRFLERVSETSVGDIYDVKKRKIFIDEILNEFGDSASGGELPIDFGDAEGGEQETIHGDGSSDESGSSDSSNGSDSGGDSGAPRPKGHNSNRRTVAPREGAPLSTQGEANLSQIHRELKTLVAHETPIACALLFRAMITISTDMYLIKKLKSEEYAKLSSKYSSRIQCACNELVRDKTSKLQNNDVDYMRKFAQNNDGLAVTLSSLHSPAHGSSGWPDGEALIVLWDKIYKVIREMLNYVQRN